jgi:hypothetical protein
MTVRTFKQMGQAYGSGPVQIVAKLDGVEIFNSTVPALDIPVPNPTTVNTDSNIFSWTDSVTFNGTKNIEIAVTGGTLILTKTIGNYGISAIPPTPVSPGVAPALVSTGPDEFTYIYANWLYDIAETPEAENLFVADPMTTVTINDVPLSSEPTSAYRGQWYWTIPSGSVFKATIVVQPGVDVV